MADIFMKGAFQGSDRLFAAMDAAVRLQGARAQTHALKEVLRTAIQDPGIVLPAGVARPLHGHYARRELYRSAALGYSVIAMCWGPGQATPLHDHDAMWCVEGVWQGELVVTPYALLEERGARCRFAAQPALYGHRGSAGSLIPPFEYHTLRNASDADIAVSLHVYQRPMQRSAVFEALGGGWYARRTRQLETDAA